MYELSNYFLFESNDPTYDNIRMRLERNWKVRNKRCRSFAELVSCWMCCKNKK